MENSKWEMRTEGGNEIKYLSKDLVDSWLYAGVVVGNFGNSEHAIEWNKDGSIRSPGFGLEFTLVPRKPKTQKFYQYTIVFPNMSHVSLFSHDKEEDAMNRRNKYLEQDCKVSKITEVELELPT